MNESRSTNHPTVRSRSPCTRCYVQPGARRGACIPNYPFKALPRNSAQAYSGVSCDARRHFYFRPHSLWAAQHPLHVNAEHQAPGAEQGGVGTSSRASQPSPQTKEMVASPLSTTLVASLHMSFSAGLAFTFHAEPGTSTTLPLALSLLFVNLIGCVGYVSQPSQP